MEKSIHAQTSFCDFERDINNWPSLASTKALVLAFLQTEIFQILHGDTFYMLIQILLTLIQFYHQTIKSVFCVLKSVCCFCF